MAEESTEELPELDGAAMEPLDQEVPMAAAPAAPKTVSQKDLTDDILGGVDFDLPSPPPSAAPVAPKMPAPKTPAPTAFKPPASLFGQSGGFGASGLKPAAPAATQRAPEPAVDTRQMLDPEPSPDAKEALRAALTSEAPIVMLPPDFNRAVLALCRTLIKKGVVTVDELLA